MEKGREGKERKGGERRKGKYRTVNAQRITSESKSQALYTETDDGDEQCREDVITTKESNSPGLQHSF